MQLGAASLANGRDVIYKYPYTYLANPLIADWVCL